MKKTILIGLCILVLVGSALAYEECGFSVPTMHNCEIITPYLSYCSTYDLDIYFSNGTTHLSNTAVTQIGSSGIYNYTANFTIADTYTVKLCDDSVRTITALDAKSWTLGTSWWSYILQIYNYVLAGGY